MLFFLFFSLVSFFSQKKTNRAHTQFTIIQIDYIRFTSAMHSTVALSYIYIYVYLYIWPNIIQTIESEKTEQKIEYKKILVENKTKHPSVCLSSAIRMYDCSNKNNTRLTIVYSHSRRDSTSSI